MGRFGDLHVSDTEEDSEDTQVMLRHQARGAQESDGATYSYRNHLTNLQLHAPSPIAPERVSSIGKEKLSVGSTTVGEGGKMPRKSGQMVPQSPLLSVCETNTPLSASQRITLRMGSTLNTRSPQERGAVQVTMAAAASEYSSRQRHSQPSRSHFFCTSAPIDPARDRTQRSRVMADVVTSVIRDEAPNEGLSTLHKSFEETRPASVIGGVRGAEAPSTDTLPTIDATIPSEFIRQQGLQHQESIRVQRSTDDLPIVPAVMRTPRDSSAQVSQCCDTLNMQVRSLQRGHDTNSNQQGSVRRAVTPDGRQVWILFSPGAHKTLLNSNATLNISNTMDCMVKWEEKEVSAPPKHLPRRVRASNAKDHAAAALAISAASAMLSNKSSSKPAEQAGMSSDVVSRLRSVKPTTSGRESKSFVSCEDVVVDESASPRRVDIFAEIRELSNAQKKWQNPCGNEMKRMKTDVWCFLGHCLTATRPNCASTLREVAGQLDRHQRELETAAEDILTVLHPIHFPVDTRQKKIMHRKRMAVASTAPLSFLLPRDWRVTSPKAADPRCGTATKWDHDNESDIGNSDNTDSIPSTNTGSSVKMCRNPENYRRNSNDRPENARTSLRGEDELSFQVFSTTNRAQLTTGRSQNPPDEAECRRAFFQLEPIPIHHDAPGAPKRETAGLHGLWCTVADLDGDMSISSVQLPRWCLQVCGASSAPHEVLFFPHPPDDTSSALRAGGTTASCDLTRPIASLPLTPRLLGAAEALRRRCGLLRRHRAHPATLLHMRQEEQRVFGGNAAPGRFITRTHVGVSTTRRHVLELSVVLTPCRVMTHDATADAAVVVEIPILSSRFLAAWRVQSVALSFTTRGAFLRAYRALLWATETAMLSAGEEVREERDATQSMIRCRAWLRDVMTRMPATMDVCRSHGEGGSGKFRLFREYYEQCVRHVASALVREPNFFAQDPYKLEDFVLLDASAVVASSLSMGAITATTTTMNTARHRPLSMAAALPATAAQLDCVVAFDAFGALYRALHVPTAQCFDVRVLTRGRTWLLTPDDSDKGEEGADETEKGQESGDVNDGENGQVSHHVMAAALLMEYVSRMPFQNPIAAVLCDARKFYIVTAPVFSALAANQAPKTRVTTTTTTTTTQTQQNHHPFGLSPLSAFAAHTLHCAALPFAARFEWARLLSAQLLLATVTLHGKGILLGPYPPWRLLVQWDPTANPNRQVHTSGDSKDDEDNWMTRDFHLLMPSISVQSDAWAYERQQDDLARYIAPRHMLHGPSAVWTAGDDYWAILCVIFELFASDGAPLLEGNNVWDKWRSVLRNTVDGLPVLHKFVQSRVRTAIQPSVDAWRMSMEGTSKESAAKGRSVNSSGGGGGGGVSLAATYLTAMREAGGGFDANRYDLSAAIGRQCYGSDVHSNSPNYNTIEDLASIDVVMHTLPYFFRALVDASLRIPSEPYAAAVLLAHPFFAGIDWAALFDGTVIVPHAALLRRRVRRKGWGPFMSSVPHSVPAVCTTTAAPEEKCEGDQSGGLYDADEWDEIASVQDSVCRAIRGVWAQLSPQRRSEADCDVNPRGIVSSSPSPLPSLSQARRPSARESKGKNVSNDRNAPLGQHSAPVPLRVPADPRLHRASGPLRAGQWPRGVNEETAPLADPLRPRERWRNTSSAERDAMWGKPTRANEAIGGMAGKEEDEEEEEKEFVLVPSDKEDDIGQTRGEKSRFDILPEPLNGEANDFDAREESAEALMPSDDGEEYDAGRCLSKLLNNASTAQCSPR